LVRRKLKSGLWKESERMSTRSVKISVVFSKLKAKKLWKKYSIVKDVWDLWEFRKIFLDIYKYPVRFVVAKRKNKIVGVLPLWFDKDQNHLEWISGWWAEKSRAFCNEKRVIKKMLDSLVQKVSLEAMGPESKKSFPYRLKRDYDHFGLNMNHVGGTWDGYLESLKSKKRQTIKWDIRQVEKLNPKVRYDHVTDLRHLFRLNIDRMNVKSKLYKDEESSVFEKDKRQMKVFRELWRRRGRAFNTRIISVLVRGKVVSCDLNLVYKDRYYTLLGGQDVAKVKGIGTYANMLDINDSIEQGCSYVDFCMEDHHWKSKWFKGTPRYKWIRKPKTIKPVVVLKKKHQKYQRGRGVAFKSL